MNNKNHFIKDIRLLLSTRYIVYVVIYSLTTIFSVFVIGQSTKVLLNQLQIEDFQQFVPYILISVAALLIAVMLSYVFRYLVYKEAENIGSRLFTTLFQHVLHLPLRFFEKNTKGDIQSRLTFDVRSIIRIYRLDLSYIASLLIGGLGSIFFIFWIRWEIGLIAIGCGLLGYFVNTRFLKPIKNQSLEISRRMGDMTGSLTEGILGHSVISIFNLQGWMNRRFKILNDKMKNTGMKINRLGIVQGLLNAILSNINTYLFLGVALLFTAHGKIQFGDMMASFYYSQSVVSLFTNLSIALVNLQGSSASLERIRELKGEEEESSQGNTIDDVSGIIAIEFQNVYFAYKESEPILKKLSFTLPKNHILFIKGPSGVGKTTIMKLLLGLYMDYTGDIRLFGKDIRAVTPENLRHVYSYVSQDIMLFDGTIRDNIAIVKDDVTDEDIMQAAKQANIHDFIVSLPGGYATSAGERGQLFSLGQRQRIAIARAFLKNAPILLVDEPLSAIDNVNVQTFYENIETLIADKTVILISHRSDSDVLLKRFAGAVDILDLQEEQKTESLSD